MFAMAEIVHSEGIALKGDDLNADMLAESEQSGTLPFMHLAHCPIC